MIRLTILTALVTFSCVVFGQNVYQLRADSIQLKSNTANAELILENGTKNVNGFLYNRGNGRTEFRKVMTKVNDSTYIVGGDTLKTSATGTSGAKAILNQYTQKQAGSYWIDTAKSLHFLLADTLGNAILDMNSSSGTLIQSNDKYPYKGLLSSTDEYNFNGPMLSFSSAADSGSKFMRNYMAAFNKGIIGSIGPTVWGDNVLWPSRPTVEARATYLLKYLPSKTITFAGNKDFMNAASMSSYKIGMQTIGNDTGVIQTGWGQGAAINHFLRFDCWPHTVENVKHKGQYINSLSYLDFQSKPGSYLESFVDYYAGSENNYGSGGRIWQKINFYAANDQYGYTDRNYGFYQEGTGKLNFFGGKVMIKDSTLANAGTYDFYNGGTSKFAGTIIQTLGRTIIGSATDDGNTNLQINGTAKITVLPFLSNRDTVLTYDPATKQIMVTKISATGSGGTTTSGWVLTGNSGTQSATNFIGTSDNTSLRFRTNNVPRMIIDSLGNIGVGTTAPAYSLDINGSIRMSTLPFQAGRDTVLSYDPSTRQLTATKLPTQTAAAWNFTGNSGATASANFLGTIDNSSLRIRTNNTQQMIVDSTGNIGIATSTPQYKLDVVGTGRISSLPFLANRDTVLTYDPVSKQLKTTKLDVFNDWTLNGNSGTTGSSFIGTTDNSSLRVRTNNTQRAIIDSMGNVGIATAAPAFTLDVNGTGRVSNLPISSSSRDTLLSYDPSTKQLTAARASGTFIGMRVLTSGSSYTPTTGTAAISIELIGGGGGGGGAIVTTNNNASCGAGGGSGALVLKYLSSVPAGSFTYAIGTAGAAGSTSGGNGGNGGTTSITVSGVTYSAPGGSGGGGGNVSGTSIVVILGGNGAIIGTNGDVNGAGQAGQYGMRVSGSVVTGGAGNSSPYGGGGNTRITMGAGNNATSYGSGGGGAVSIGTASVGQLGGTGSSGVIIIYEYR